MCISPKHGECKLNTLVRASVFEDVEYLSENLRAEDVEEVMAIGQTPFDALSHGFIHSNPCLTLIDPHTNNPGAILGVCGSGYPNMGIIWLLGTPAIEKNTVKFLRGSKQVMQEVEQAAPYEAFYNYTHANNTVHHRWLKWLGFKFTRKVTMNGHEFYEVIKLREGG